MDEHTRKNAGLPPYRQNSWRAGLDRLLLGYAMQDEGRLFNGILPFGDVDASLPILSAFLLRLLKPLSVFLHG